MSEYLEREVTVVTPPFKALRLTADRPAARQLAAAVCLGFAYYVSGYYGIVAKMPPAGIAAVWPPGAILLAALLLTPRHRWWQSIAVVAPLHAILFIRCVPEMTTPTMLSQLVGYLAQALLAAEWLRRLGGHPPRFDTLRGVTHFVLVGALAVPMIISTVIVTVYGLTGWVTDFWTIWRQRVLANVVGLLTLTPLIVVTVNGGIAYVRRTSFARYVEFGALMLATCAVVVVVFGWKSDRQSIPALLYTLPPLLIWAAVRFEPGALFACLVVIAFGSLLGAYHGRGPFETLSRPENVLALQLCLIALSIPKMLLTALIQERSRAAGALRDSQARYRMATAAGSSGVWDWNLRSGTLYLDPSLKALLGYQDHEVENTMAAWTQCIHPDDRAVVVKAVELYLAGASRSLEVEHRSQHKDGSVRWMLCRGVTTEVADGVPVRVVGTDTDITERKVVELALQRSHKRVREMTGRLISAQEEERKRIARDLHDNLNQKIAGLSIQLSNVKQQIPASEQTLIRQVSKVQSHTADLVNDIRDLSHDIHPSILDHGGLVSALREFSAELERLENFKLRLTLSEQAEQLPPGVTIGIYRIAQEAIRNVLRHAATPRADISVAVNDNKVTLLIEDQGRGFDFDHVRESGGLGLISIEERVRLLDGQLHVSSQSGLGTSLRIEVPLGRNAVA